MKNAPCRCASSWIRRCPLTSTASPSLTLFTTNRRALRNGRTAMANANINDSARYYIPSESHWPIIGSFALFSMMLGAISYLNDWAPGWVFLPGAILVAVMFFGWFHTVIGENQHGMYNMQVDRSFRMGMMWFIFSEVMFFAAFFGALFYARMLSVPWLGGQGVKFF